MNGIIAPFPCISARERVRLLANWVLSCNGDLFLKENAFRTFYGGSCFQKSDMEENTSD
jgi:hypothetical protein